jgi:membrane associated rhomboid family serine protease
VSLLPYPRLTPWVLRLLVINAVVLLLMETLFTSPELRQALAFVPDAALARPWTFVSYMFVHGGFGHLLFNSIALFVFGAAVESRMGSRQFLLYYLYCGVGAAIFSLLLLNFLHVSSSFYGASGAILGVMVAFAVFWPDAEMLVFPIPVPVRARTLVIGLLAIDVVFSLWPGNDGVAHPAHLGGAVAGWLFLRLQMLSHRAPVEPARSVERVVMVQSGAAEEPERRVAPTPLPRRPRPATDSTGAELDRVLDKISASGIASLTPAERRFLDEVSRRKQRGVH